MQEKRVTKVNTTIRITDQLGFPITLSAPATRIISLVPSLTELLFDLGLGDRIIGRTKFCIFPESGVQSVEVIGGTKNVNIEKIQRLNPDLIIANKEENIKDTVRELSALFPVYTSNISTLHSALHAIEDIGILTKKENTAQTLINDIEVQFSNLDEHLAKKRKCIYLIWKDPYMTIGKDTFIYQMLKYAGFDSVIDDFRYPTLTIKDIRNSDAEHILLSSEPFPFKQKHIEYFEEVFPNKKIHLVDGTYYSWYGSRIKHAPSYFKKGLRV